MFDIIMNINKEILLKVLANESIESNRLKVLYDWNYPSDSGSLTETDYQNISLNFNMLFNSVYGIDTHLINLDTTKISLQSMMGLSVGLSHNATTVSSSSSGNNYAQFDGDDIIYMANSALISNWTVLVDIENFPCSQNKNKSKILFTNKNQITDTNGFIIGINGANNLFYEGSDGNGNKLIKTLIKPIGEKSILAVSRSTDLVNLYIYNPVTNKSTFESFSVGDKWTSADWSIGGTKTNFTNDNDYEKLEANINSILFFDLDLNNSIVQKILETFTLTSFTPKSYQDVATQVPRAGQYVQRQVEDGLKADGYQTLEMVIPKSDGTSVTAYNSVPKLVKKYKTVTQYVAGTGTVTQNVSTLVAESKVKDTASSKAYLEKCVLLNKSASKTQKVEFYARDAFVGDSNLKATFGPAESTFFVSSSYNNARHFIFYLNGLLMEPDIDYQVVNNTHVKKVSGSFLETDIVTYDTYTNTKTFSDFYGYNGNILLYGESGKDVYLDGKKLIFGVNYDDYNSNYLIIYAGSLLAGRLGLLTRSTNVTHNGNFTDKFYHCNNYNMVEEQVWVDGLKAVRDSEYHLTCSCNLNNSNNDKSEEKTTIIYNNEDKYFNI